MHEDCLKIMDAYENMLSELYTEAHGIVFTCQHLKGGGQSFSLTLNQCIHVNFLLLGTSIQIPLCHQQNYLQ
jgi:hypothetical protein